MSRLQGRLGRLEQVAVRQGCPGCADQPAVIELVGPNGKPQGEAALAPCPLCDERPELISVHVAFDPGRADGDER